METPLRSCPFCDWTPEPPERAPADPAEMDNVVRGHVSDEHPDRYHELPAEEPPI